ncbi:MAG: hypothetical protein V4561_02370 [Bacteroidota bacterium]
MFKERFFKSPQMKIITGIAIVAGIIIIFRGGYSCGQWLYQAMH